MTLFACVFLSHSLHLNDFIATTSTQETPQQLVCESLSSFFKRSGKSETPEMTSISNIQTILITIAATAAEAMRWTVEFIYGLAPTSKTVFLDLTM